MSANIYGTINNEPRSLLLYDHAQFARCGRYGVITDNLTNNLQYTNAEATTANHSPINSLKSLSLLY